MEDKIKEKKITGPEGIGTPRPGTAETTEQVSAGSLSSGCKATACGVDPRPYSQWTTGTNFSINMNNQRKGNKITGAGEIGGPRGSVRRECSGFSLHRYRTTAKESRWRTRPAPPRVLLERGIQALQSKPVRRWRL